MAQPSLELEGEDLFQFDKDSFQEQVSGFCLETHRKFQRAIQFYVVFNMIFVSVVLFELFSFFMFFAFLAKSSLLAVSLAVLFLTSFSYFVLRLYFQARIPDQRLALREDFLDDCRGLLNYQKGIPEHHMAIASACVKFAGFLHDKEYSYYAVPERLEVFAPTMEKFSCWWHWRDLYKMRESLLRHAVEEHIMLVKCEPTNLEAHATLANAYVMLSSLYSGGSKGDDDEQERWVPPDRYSEGMQKKFRYTAERAIEEFKILSDYAPNDPWVHAQLAYSYHDLQMPEEEIREYEIILKIRTNDLDTMFKLGVLYFQQGLNAKGLRLYEELLAANYKKAESLIKFYGTYPLTPDLS